MAPEVVHAASDPLLVKLSRVLIGRRICAVRYLVPIETDWYDENRGHRVHDVGLGVEIVTCSDVTLRLTWATPSVGEGLRMELFDSRETTVGMIAKSVEVGGIDDWGEFIGKKISGLGVAFYSHDGHSEDRLWAVGIRVEEDGLSVCLGEMESGGHVEYCPDNLVVLFGEATARPYTVAEGRSSSWGHEIVG